MLGDQKVKVRVIKLNKKLFLPFSLSGWNRFEKQCKNQNTFCSFYNCHQLNFIPNNIPPISTHYGKTLELRLSDLKVNCISPNFE